MYSQLFEYKSDATVRKLSAKMKPLAVISVPLAAAQPSIHMDGLWCGRTLPLGAGPSFSSAIRVFDNDILIGDSATVNTSGTVYKTLVIGAANGDVEEVGWCGNATEIVARQMQASKKARFIMAMRDNAYPTVLKADGYPTVNSDGTAITDCITLEVGQFRLGNEPEVNQWDSGAAAGEGTSALVFYDEAVKVGVMVGTGAARVEGLGVDGTVIAWREDGTEPAWIIPRGSSNFKKFDATAPVAGGRLMNGRLALTGTTLNATGVRYVYVVIPHREPSIPETHIPAVVTGRKALYLDGRGGSQKEYVDFGAGLNITGPKAITWFGAVVADPNSGEEFDTVLFAKASAANHANTPGNASWGLIAPTRIDGGYKWAGPHIVAVVTGRMFYGSSTNIADSVWRTGKLVPRGFAAHTFVERADGTREYWRSGHRLIQRKLPTDISTADPTHRVTMGARWNGSDYSDSSRLAFIEMHIAATDPTPDEIIAEHARLEQSLGSNCAIRQIAARYRADDITGNMLPDLVGANHGTITNGIVLTL